MSITQRLGRIALLVAASAAIAGVIATVALVFVVPVLLMLGIAV